MTTPTIFADTICGKTATKMLIFEAFTQTLSCARCGACHFWQTSKGWLPYPFTDHVCNNGMCAPSKREMYRRAVDVNQHKATARAQAQAQAQAQALGYTG